MAGVYSFSEVMTMETFLFLLELAGTVAFAVSGAVLGIESIWTFSAWGCWASRRPSAAAFCAISSWG